MGLKPNRRRTFSAECSSQSHHSGIETLYDHSHITTDDGSQSHHSGIETAVDDYKEFVELVSQSHHSGIETTKVKSFYEQVQSRNRTIVGLKPKVARGCRSCSGASQSHHSGIET